MLVADWWLSGGTCAHAITGHVAARAARGQEHILVTKWYF